MFVALTQALVTTTGIVGVIATNISNIYESSITVSYFFQFLELPDEYKPRRPKLFPSPLKKSIEIKQLSFKYPSHNDYVLENVSFKINIGEKIAIVGDNGAGKSTLAKCLVGLYEVENGKIIFDDIELREMDLAEYRNHVAVLFQDFVHYYLKIRENIAVGNISKLQDDNELKLAAEMANLTNLVNKCEDGLDTELGNLFEEGTELSGGQWQKVALSRVFLRNAEIIVLDEPTASLDPMTEAEIFKQFINAAKNKTAIFITHRLGSCRFADRILVLKNGRIVEQGSHNELIYSKGEYARMFHTQAHNYI
ncbi:ABC transporter ATP-binding protein [Paenibacillus chitinolyticus]